MCFNNRKMLFITYQLDPSFVTYIWSLVALKNHEPFKNRKCINQYYLLNLDSWLWRRLISPATLRSKIKRRDYLFLLDRKNLVMFNLFLFFIVCGWMMDLERRGEVATGFWGWDLGFLGRHVHEKKWNISF